ncbi:metallopeptidase family protein [Corynebacterium sp. sy017]|uniref:metallopeptidase family protein n=1 Tax=unclassified Corynebacterium TaxID=2624378 RepID=UPI0011855FB6|nr:MULTISPECIES: metallopeptidase family protein [unclassified Corynebacterium]MBP3088725.1 metallopeptidase family protein [Corynebacterium sp. sy017]QDZ42121.1 metallopeptidase family protein [Corynebacterium sp. sy039]TSD92008.1 metallopeptidase family protein [Corynebacterium sp. SY003]
MYPHNPHSPRDRHGRGIRSMLLPPDVPRHRTRRQLFDAAVVEAYSPIEKKYAQQLSNVDVVVDTVPHIFISNQPRSLETNEPIFSTSDGTIPVGIVRDGSVPLGCVISAGSDRRRNPTKDCIVIFRMPIEQRSQNKKEQYELLQKTLIALVADYLEIAPEDIDPYLYH